MAEKPLSGLPDVFARPGDAPVRGTPIEDLPQTAEHTASPDGSGVKPAVETAAAPPIEPPQARTYGMEQRVGIDAQSNISRNAGQAVAWIALFVGLTAPFWEGTVLRTVGIRTPAVATAEQGAAKFGQQDTKLAAVEQRLAVATGQLDAMQGALATATRQAEEATAQVRSLAMLRLADRLRGSSPFGAELRTLRAAGETADGLKPVLSELEPYAATGIPTLGQLHQDLMSLYDGVVRVARQSAQKSWMDLVNWTGLSGLPEAIRADPTVSAVASGMNRLAAQDIAGAIEQAQLVGGTFQAPFADWIADAKARLAANRVLQQIELLTGKTASPPRSP